MTAVETENGAAPAPAAGLPMGTVEEILARGFDLREETVEVPEWGCSVKIRTPTASDRSRIKGAAMKLDGRGKPHMDLDAMEAMQFRLGVIEPKFSEVHVLQLRQRSGPGFARVIDALDEMGGGDDKEALLAQREFPGSED